jgi:hypothetical protein
MEPIRSALGLRMLVGRNVVHEVSEVLPLAKPGQHSVWGAARGRRNNITSNRRRIYDQPGVGNTARRPLAAL